MHELKSDYTIVVVTHNMQQAARVADRTAFFSVEVGGDGDRRTGILVEYDETNKIFTQPSDQADRGLRHREVRMSTEERQTCASRSRRSSSELEDVAARGGHSSSCARSARRAQRARSSRTTSSRTR